MNTHRSNSSRTQKGDLAATQERLLASESEKEIARRHALSAAGFLLGAAIVVATLSMLTGCGDGSTPVASTPAPAPMQQNAVASVEPARPAPAPVVRHPQPGGETRSVAPDVVFAVSDTFVTAGQPIEVTASATEDVTAMALSDGRGDSLPMVRDTTGGMWRVNYRVPLRPHGNRLGLSVTAKNDTQQWRRVWLFLQVTDGKPQVQAETPSDSTSDQK